MSFGTDSAQTASGLPAQQYLTLLELSKAIASHREMPDLIHELAGHLHKLFDFQNLAVMLHDPRRNLMRTHTLDTTQPAMLTAPTQVPVAGSIAGWVWQNQKPFLTGDVQQETGFVTTQIARNFPVRSLCILPLTTANESLGVLSFSSDKTGVYDDLDLDFAQLVAGQIAVAMEAQCYRDQLTHERDRSQLLLEINNTLVSNLNLRELLSAISACLRKVIPHDGAGLALYDSESDTLQASALEFPANEELFIENESIPLEGTSAGRAFMGRQTVISKTHEFQQLPFIKRFAEAGVKSVCSAPLISHDRALGALTVASLNENAFSEEDAELLGQVAGQVAIAVENALAFREIDTLKDKLTKEKLYLEEEIQTEYNFEEIIGNSPALKEVLKDVETVAATDSTVLIFGETGTGKELIARAIHNLSQRRDRTLVRVNCAAIPTGLLESEMFGHEKGAFTGAIERRIGRFELANKGTIFLDEVEDIPVELQPKLLRVLQEQEFERLGSARSIRVDVRVVAATNVDLHKLVMDKKFRNDLFYRLNVFPISLPPLRERREDIALLVPFFVNKSAQQMNKTIERIPRETMQALMDYSWPGNIRELQNLIERAVILTRGTVLQVPLSELKQSGSNVLDKTHLSTLESVEREHILRVLRDTSWVIGGPNGAAARLGLNRTTLNNRLRKLGITRPRA
ncbi:MAG TPA: sigma 54-interacting transcriptional regulator [Blastocatellia bacterium]|nr:sigma 54-interacting transcriptional regulator [Blastocatellia bacterium]